MLQIGIYLVLGAFALSLLPQSPFTSFIDSMDNIPYIDVISWVLPINEFILIFEVWLTAITVFYSVSLILRWIKVIS